MTAKGIRVPFGNNEDVLKLFMEMVTQFYECTLQMGEPYNKLIITQ